MRRHLATATYGPPGDCPDDELLVLRSVGSLPPDSDQWLNVERHLSRCPACAVASEDLEGGAAVGARRPSSPRAKGRVLASVASRLRELVAFELPPAFAINVRNAGSAVAREAASFASGMRAYVEGDLDAAYEHFSAAAVACEAAADLPLFVGVLALRRGEIARAVEALSEAERRVPRSGEVAWYQAQAYLTRGDAALAAAALTRAAKLPGAHRAAARSLGRRLSALLDDRS